MPVKTDARVPSILPFFPLGFPDETIGSRVSRYHIRRGRPTIQVTYKQLFDKAPFSLTGLVQPNLDKLAERLPGLPRHNLVQLQNDSTLLPLFQQFFGPKSATRHPDRIPGPPLIKLPRRIKGDNRLTYICTHCLVDDERDHGCPYIHRAHQIPGVTACWKHSIRLLDRCPSCGCPFAEPKQLILSAWMGCECGCALADQARPDLQPASAVEVEFARFAQVLLAAKPSKLSIEQLIDIYKVRAIEIGCQWGDKRVNHSMLLGKIEAHFGAELFAKIDPAYKSGKTEHWLNILCAHSAVEAPLTRHLMAAYFLFRDATLFLSRADAILYAKPELGDPPHITGVAPRSSNDNVESIKRPEEELLDELVNLAQRDHYDIAQLWRHHFGSMKRVVKLLPNASEVIERRLASAAAKQKKDAARALKVREQRLVRDAQWSEAVKASAVELYGENARPVRVTKNRLLQASKSKSKSSWPAGPGFPLTAAAISANEESLWHFYARRILWTLQCLHDPHTTEHKIIALSKLEVNKFRVIMEYFSDFVPCGGGSIQVIKSILKSRGLAKNWQGPCPEREFYKAGRAYRLRTARRGPIWRPRWRYTTGCLTLGHTIRVKRSQMDIHCLPIARSDETLYSVVARIRLANAARNDIDACQSLFGHSRNTRVSDFPVNLKRFCDVTQDCFGDPARVLADMTLSGFFERLGSRPWNSGSAPAPIIAAGYGLSTLSNGAAGRWRMCLHCVESDLRCHATAFWRRAHHLPTAFVCPIHATPLASCMLAPLERHKRFLLPEQIEAAPLKAYVDWAAHYHTLNRLTMLGMDVLKDTRQSIDADTVHATLLNALDNHGLLTATGMLRRVPFSSEFVHRYQFLSGHRDFTPALSPQGIAILQRSFIHPAPPRSAIHNLLLVDWLFGSWQAFHQHCHWQATMDCTPSQQARHAPEAAPQTHRRRCLEFLDSDGKATRSRFARAAPTSFRWLLRFDQTWFDATLPIRSKNKQPGLF